MALIPSRIAFPASSYAPNAACRFFRSILMWRATRSARPKIGMSKSSFLARKRTGSGSTTSSAQISQKEK
jgi:hypothetical protein